MNKITKTKVIKFLEQLAGEKANSPEGFRVLTNIDEARKIDQYAGGWLWVAFDGSSLYEAFNHYDEGDCYARDNRWHKFCEENGIWSEMGYAWSMNIYKKEKTGSTAQ